MADYTAKKIEDIEAIMQGGFKRARAELGVESFGMQVIEMPPGFDDYPEHDHAETWRGRGVPGAARIRRDRTSTASACSSTRTRSFASGRARSARSSPATRECACSRWAGRRVASTKRPRSRSSARQTQASRRHRHLSALGA